MINYPHVQKSRNFSPNSDEFCGRLGAPSTPLLFERDHRDGVRVCVTEADPDGTNISVVRQISRTAAEHDERLAAWFFVHIDIAPAHCFTDAGPESFRYSLFRGKTRRKMARRIFHRLAVGDLACGKNAMEKTLTKTFQRTLNPLRFHHIDTDSEDAHPL
jgi:hypothetical protein